MATKDSDHEYIRSLIYLIFLLICRPVSAHGIAPDAVRPRYISRLLAYAIHAS